MQSSCMKQAWLVWAWGERGAAECLIPCKRGWKFWGTFRRKLWGNPWKPLVECWETAGNPQGVDCGQRQARHVDQDMVGLGVREPTTIKGIRGALPEWGLEGHWAEGSSQSTLSLIITLSSLLRFRHCNTFYLQKLYSKDQYFFFLCSCIYIVI